MLGTGLSDLTGLSGYYQSESEKAVIFRSLVATVKLKPALDVALEAKAVRFLKAVHTMYGTNAAAFLDNFGQTGDDSSTNFIQSIVVLISLPSQVITTTTMEILISLYGWCSPKVRLTLVHADLVPQLIMTLNPLSLSFTEAADIHEYLMNSIVLSFKQITPYGLAKLGIKDRNEQQAVHKTVFTQVLVPSEKYICHLCTNRNSIINGKQSESFLELLAQLLEQSLYYQPTLDFVLHLPVFLPIPSCLSFFENERSIRQFLRDLVVTLREWNEKGGEVRQIWKTVHRLLRMEDIEDVIDTKLGNDKNASYGRSLVANSISLNNLQGMNIPEQE